MGQNNFIQKHKKSELFAFIVTILSVVIYVLPLILNLNNSFTLFPKNIPSFYANYSFGLFLKDSILKFHSFPLWVPIFEGGRPLFEYPTDVSLNPFSVFIILFGEIPAINITWFLFFIFGAASMFYLARGVLGYNIFGSIFSSLAFSMSGLFAYLFENGISYSRDVLLLPLLLAFFIKAKENSKYLILCSFVLSLLLTSAILFSPVIILFLALFVFVSSFKFKGFKVIIDSTFFKIFLAVCFITLLLSAVKILPFLKLLSLNNRISGIDYQSAILDANTWSLFKQRLLAPIHSGPGTMYLGLLPVLLCLSACLFFFRKLKTYLIILLIFIILSFGPNSFIDLHKLLWHLPIFKSLREIAKYYAVIIVFLIALIGGKTFSLFSNLKLKALSVLVPAVIILAVYLNLLNSNTGYFNSFNIDLKYKPSAGEIFHVKGLNIHQGDESISGPLFYFLAKKNIGLINFESFLKQNTNVVPRYYLLPKYAFLMPYTALLVLPNPNYKGGAFFINKNNYSEIKNISPNLIIVKIDSLGPDRLVINQNFDQDWHSNRGKIEDHNGLLSVRLDAKENGLLRLTYFPMLFFIGLSVSLVSLMASIYVLIKK